MRIAALVATIALAAATAAPASACIVYTMDSILFETPPEDLASNELVLEVKFEKAEPYNLPPFFENYTSRWVSSVERGSNYRFSVVRVVRGEFSGGVVLAPVSSICGGVLTRPENGAETGLIVGFLAPSSPDWRDAPVMVARYAGTSEFPRPVMPTITHPRFVRFDTSLFFKGLNGDPAAMKTLGLEARDPVARKLWFDRASDILRSRAESGDTSAMVELGLAMLQGRAPSPVPSSGQQTDPARDWIERAAALGNAEALYQMTGRGMMDFNTPVAERLAKSAAFMLKAAEAGHACAMGLMAETYRVGKGVPQNKEQALYWYRKAIAAGAILSPYGYEIEGDPPPGTPSPPSLQCPATP